MAIAGLVIVLLDKGPHDAHQESAGMIAGAVGMSAYAAAVIPLLRRLRAGRGAVIALGAWFLAAAIVALPVMLG